MERIYCFLFVAFLAPTAITAQSSYEKFIAIGDNTVKNKASTHKALGDTLYYQDFDSTGRSANNFLPSGWTSIDHNNNGFVWIWSDQPPGGQYSTNIGTLNSSTASNGYLCMPADFYNTPFPSGGPVQMDATVESSAISLSLTSAVTIEFKQYYRYCCQQNNSNLTLEVSNDGVNWVEYHNATVIPQSTTLPNGNLVSVDVSPTLAGQSTAYVRFNFNNASQYFWMIDDLVIKVGATNNMVLEDFKVNFTDSFTYNPLYTQVIECLSQPISFEGATYNAAINTQTNVELRAEVFQDSTSFGATGVGNVYSSSTLIANSVPYLQRDTAIVNSPKYNISNAGLMRARIEVTSDSINQRPQTAVGEYSFYVTDSVFARDRGTSAFQGKAGPANYSGGGNDGDKWGVLYAISGNTSLPSPIASTVSYYVAGDTNNIGAHIQPRIWSFQGDTISNVPVCSSPISTVIDSSKLDKWVSIPFFPACTLQRGLQYLVGWEQIGGDSIGASFSVARDPSMESVSPAVTNFIYLNGSNPSWGWVTQVAAVRLNFGRWAGGCSIVGEKQILTNQDRVSFKVFPIPAKDYLQLELPEGVELRENIHIRDIQGKVLRTYPVKAGGNSQQIALSGLKAGIYFISIRSTAGQLWNKKFIKH